MFPMMRNGGKGRVQSGSSCARAGEASAKHPHISNEISRDSIVVVILRWIRIGCSAQAPSSVRAISARTFCAARTFGFPVQGERGGNGTFDRSRRSAQMPYRARLQPQAGAPAVARIALPLQVSSRDEPLQDAGNRARMQSEDVRQIACGEIGKLTDHPQHQPLRHRDAHLLRHPLRHSLEVVLDRPEQPHELQRRLENIGTPGRCVGARHGRASYQVPGCFDVKLISRYSSSTVVLESRLARRAH